MRFDEHIARWRDSGLITPAQADRMRADLATEGALAPSEGRIGPLLMVLAALLNGVVLLVFAWLYNVDANLHVSLLLWMACLAPLLYLLRKAVLAVIFGSLFLAWVGLFVLRGYPPDVLFLRMAALPVLYLAAGTTLFAWGGLHYAVRGLDEVARAFRLLGVGTVMGVLLLLGSWPLSEAAGSFTDLKALSSATRFSGVLVVTAVAGAALTVVNQLVRLRQPRLTRPEGPISLFLLALAPAHFFLSLPAMAFVVFFNVVTVAFVGAVLAVGYQRRDLLLTDVGSGGLWLFLLARYVDFGWGHLDAAVFLGVGIGLALVSGAALAWKRGAVKREAVAAAAGPAGG